MPRAARLCTGANSKRESPVRRQGVSSDPGARGKPGMIVSDHGAEYTCNAMLVWCRENGVDWHFNAPGTSMRNRVAENFNGRMRDELLDEIPYFDHYDARAKIEAWVAAR